MRLSFRATAAAALAILTPSAATPQQLTGAGATFPYPLYSEWFDAYHRAHTGVTISYQSIGSGGGIHDRKVGTVDFGASDAPLSDAEVKDMPGPVVHFPTAAGAVVLAYNVPGVSRLKLTGDVIAAIFLGKITRWSDSRITRLNPRARLPGRQIVVVHRSDGHGSNYIFTNYLAAVSPEWKRRVGAGLSVNWPVGIGAKGSVGVPGLETV